MQQSVRKNMPAGQFIKTVFNTFSKNLLDIITITILFTIPSFLGAGNPIISVISMLALGFFSIAIVKVTSSFTSGSKMKWIDAIKSSFKDPIFPLSVFMIQNFTISFGTRFFAPIGIVLSIFFVIAMQCCIFENKNTMDSIKKSFSVIKENFLDVLLKQMLLMIILNFLTMGLAMFLGKNIISIIVLSIVLNLTTSLNLIAGNIIYGDIVK
ncbi:hypothetical protein [Clostridium sp.]|uniref:hypothetical protein n=1 Tax=Clostridium sp. TaxID=1506 RepID=UPI00262A8BB2|nr:hypothetical protein [Clostridium sp.]